MRAIHQFVAGFSKGDAISNEALALRTLFRQWGHASEIFSETRRILPELRKEAHDAFAFEKQCTPDDLVLLHLSIGSPLNALFAALPCRKAILYHNVTPAAYLERVNKQTALHLERGRSEAASLAGAATVVMADSRFNAAELEAMGYGSVQVLPLVLDFEKLQARPDPQVTRQFADGVTNVLCVGRCAPNKKVEDVLMAFFHYHRFINKQSRLLHVGSWAGTESYYYMLCAQARSLGLANVHFAGSVPQAQLNAFYACADVFLCMSEHEGFCIPLIESMHFDLPVLAYAAGAVPETLDGAGILAREKRFPDLAEMMNRAVSDTALRNAVIDAQRQRLARYRRRNLEAELRQHLAPVLT